MQHRIDFSLVTADAIDREMNAVNNEHLKNFQSDSRRQYEVFKRISDQRHPFTKFATGNIATLNHTDIRKRMMDFYTDNYSSHRMKLVLYCNMTTPQLSSLAENLFSDVPEREVKPLMYVEKEPIEAWRPFSGKLVRIEPVKETQRLEVAFITDDLHEKIGTDRALRQKHINVII